MDGEEGTYSEMMGTVPRKAILDQREEPKSQFDKPYLNSEYDEMEYRQPPLPGDLSITNPSLNFPDSPNPVPTLPPPGETVVAALSCFAPQYCHEPVECHFAVVSGADVAELMNRIKAYVNGSSTSVKLEGGIRPIKVYPNPCWAVWPDEKPMDTVEVQAWYRDEAGKLLLLDTEAIKVFCQEGTICGCDCEAPEEGEFTFDAGSTPDTITPGGSIDVYVTGGCPPFTWSVSGTGYSFTAAETTARVNTLNCASGDCGDEFDPVAKITVTDNCDSVVGTTADIRVDTGSWNQVYSSSDASGTIRGSGNYYTDNLRVYFAFRERGSVDVDANSCAQSYPVPVISLWSPQLTGPGYFPQNMADYGNAGKDYLEYYSEISVFTEAIAAGLDMDWCRWKGYSTCYFLFQDNACVVGQSNQRVGRTAVLYEWVC